MSTTSPTSTSSAVVRVTDLRRSFGDRVVLDDLDLAIEPGQFVALLGRSGCGKSTFLRILAGLDPDAEGDVVVPARRSVVFQEPRLVPWKRVLPNVTLGLGGDQRRARAVAALGEVGLEDQARAWPGTLSGGEAQRVALARALVREPALLLLDEPFGALDALTRLRAQALVGALWARHRPAVLLVTHDVDEALLLADRVLVLDGGRFAFDQAIHVARPRRREDPTLVVLRRRLLATLGVDEDEASGGP